MAISLKEKLEAAENQESIKPEVSPVKRLTNSAYEKDKVFSIRLNAAIYAQFVAINKKNGVTTNSQINNLISKYVRDYIKEYGEDF